MNAQSLADMQRSIVLMAKTQGRLVARIADLEDKVRSHDVMRARLDVLEVALLSMGGDLPVETAGHAAMSALPTESEQRKILEAASAAAEETGVAVQMILSASRRKEVVLARWVAMGKASDAGMSAKAISRALGKDHTTVLHGLRQVRRQGGA